MAQPTNDLACLALDTGVTAANRLGVVAGAEDRTLLPCSGSRSAAAPKRRQNHSA
jgi:hypothetical protein